MSFLRAKQRTITALSPHPGNPTHLIPSRPLVQFVAGRKLLLFGGDTFITIAGFSIDNDKANTITYSMRIDDDTAIRQVWGFAANTSLTRFFGSSTVRVNRGGSARDLSGLTIVLGQVYSPVTEVFTIVSGPEIDYELTPGQSSSGALVGATGINTGITIGASPTGSEPMIGVIADFKFFDGTGFLVNHYPIDDDVIDGGTIVDVAGGQDGILTLGSGGWFDSPALPP